MDRITAYKGVKFAIAYARLESGQSPGFEFFSALSIEDKAKLMNLFRLIADHGAISNKEKFGDLGDGLYEFKSFQIRMPFAYAKERGLVLITHGFLKKKDTAPKEEIKRAWRIFNEDQERAKKEQEQTKLQLIKKRER